MNEINQFKTCIACNNDYLDKHGCVLCADAKKYYQLMVKEDEGIDNRSVRVNRVGNDKVTGGVGTK